MPDQRQLELFPRPPVHSPPDPEGYQIGHAIGYQDGSDNRYRTRHPRLKTHDSWRGYADGWRNAQRRLAERAVAAPPSRPSKPRIEYAYRDGFRHGFYDRHYFAGMWDHAAEWRAWWQGWQEGRAAGRRAEAAAALSAHTRENYAAVARQPARDAPPGYADRKPPGKVSDVDVWGGRRTRRG